MRQQMTVKQLKEAIADKPDDAIVEIAASQYNKVYPHYMRIDVYADRLYDSVNMVGNTVRIHTRLPETDTQFSILSMRKK